MIDSTKGNKLKKTAAVKVVLDNVGRGLAKSKREVLYERNPKRLVKLLTSKGAMVAYRRETIEELKLNK